jgi:hypothetical protein
MIQFFYSIGLALAWLLASGFKWGHEAIEAVRKQKPNSIIINLDIHSLLPI